MATTTAQVGSKGCAVLSLTPARKPPWCGNSLSGHFSQLCAELCWLTLSSHKICLAQEPSQDHFISLKIW